MQILGLDAYLVFDTPCRGLELSKIWLLLQGIVAVRAAASIGLEWFSKEAVLCM